MAPQLALGIGSVLLALALGLLLRAARSSSSWRPSPAEAFVGLKIARTVVFSALVICQGALVLGHVLKHWPQLAWDLDGTQALTLGLYCAVLALLLLRWRTQLSLQLSAVLLVALLQPCLLFWLDVTGVRPDASFDAEHVARVLLHGLQVVLLVGLLVADVIIQQHQLLQRSSFDDALLPATNGGSHSTGGRGGAGYQPLPGSDADAARGKRQQQAWQQQTQCAWRPGDSRWRMTACAFQYVWPTSGVLKVRLLACLLLVLFERAINLAAPIAFKHMVEVLSAATTPAAAAAAQAATDAGPAAALAAGARRLLAVAAAGLEQLQAAAAAPAPAHAAAAAAAAATAHNSTAAAAGGGGGGSGDALLAVPFWTLFWPWAFVYLASFFLRGGSGSEGLLANLRDILWIPITQAAFRRISCDVFGHLLALDLNFHVHRKTGQVMRILDRGTSSIQDSVSIVLFNVVPQLIDIVVACSYLASAMRGPWVAIIVLLTVGSYVPLTLIITEQRGKVRKRMNELDNERESRATDMLLNYETIKYFCAEAQELRGYDHATRQYQAAEYWQMAFLSLLSLVQSLVVWLGLAAGLVVCVWGAGRGVTSVGDTVLFISLMQQLYVPLTFFGSYYRQVTKALIDMENMFELLATRPAVRDEPGAVPLRIRDGGLEFRQVVFSYSPGVAPPVLRGLSFAAPGGRSLAVVGSTGSGKSTMLRLLLRFYDPLSGAVLIDGQDIRRCTQASVRGAIGVVPQDCVLFNDSILYNIRYGRPSASDAEVYQAAQVSHIHDHLLRFPHGYQTRVGERGLRLSGGEKQRVAFARAVLKAPALLVLDEATSSLDSLTERLIQDSLAAIRGTCTQVIVAHRLSTIMDADRILVLDKGQVAEAGDHASLIEAGGMYAAMWARQQDSATACPTAAPTRPGSDGGDVPGDGDDGGGGEQQQQQQQPSRQPALRQPAGGAAPGQDDGQPRSGIGQRCSSSFGHGRHANLWSREQNDEEEDEDEAGEGGGTG